MRHFWLPVVLALIAALPASAQQTPFTAAITVNDRAVTWWELEQRERLLLVLNAPGDLPQRAREELIDDRLRQDVAARVGFEMAEEDLVVELEAFAARGGLSLDELYVFLAEQGVAPETLRDFVRTQSMWRAIVQGRFGPQIQISEEEIDRAVALSAAGSGTSVLLSEIILPITPQIEEENRALADQLSRSIDSFAAFSTAARTYSVSPSAARGGQLDWVALSDLPASLGAILLTLAPGEVTEPLPIPDAIVIFQMRDLRERAVPMPAPVALDYLEVLIPGGRSGAALQTAATLAARLDTCDDIYGQGQLVKGGFVTRDTLPTSQVPREVAIELAKLDPNEVSMTLTRTTASGTYLRFLMLCGRVFEVDELTEEATQAREAARRSLVGQRLESLGESFLAELRAEARIVEK